MPKSKQFKDQLSSLTTDLKTHAQFLAEKIKVQAMAYTKHYNQYKNIGKTTTFEGPPSVSQTMGKIALYMSQYLKGESLGRGYENTLKHACVYEGGFVNNSLAFEINTLNATLSEFDRTLVLINHIEGSERHELISTDYNELVAKDLKLYNTYSDILHPIPFSSFEPYSPKRTKWTYDVRTISSHAFSKIFKRIKKLFSCESPSDLQQDIQKRMERKKHDHDKNKTEENKAKYEALKALHGLVTQFVTGKINGYELAKETGKLGTQTIGKQEDPAAFRAFRKSVTLDFFDKVMKMGDMYGTSIVEPSNNPEDGNRERLSFKV